jgi:integration host factor subunit alpha
LDTHVDPPKGITRSDRVVGVSKVVPLAPKAMVRNVLETVLEEITQTLVQGKAVKLRGFGSFVVRAKTERLGRNPRTGEPATIVPRRVLSFKPSPGLLAMMNDEEPPVGISEDLYPPRFQGRHR